MPRRGDNRFDSTLTTKVWPVVFADAARLQSESPSILPHRIAGLAIEIVHDRQRENPHTPISELLGDAALSMVYDGSLHEENIKGMPKIMISPLSGTSSWIRSISRNGYVMSQSKIMRNALAVGISSLTNQDSESIKEIAAKLDFPLETYRPYYRY